MSSRAGTIVTPPATAMTKEQVVRELGELNLILPSLVNRGLEANDRAKYLLTLLQGARAHADAPSDPFSPLRDERLAAGVADEFLDTVVEEARRTDQDAYLIPGADAIHGALATAVAEMLAPLTADVAPDAVDVSRLDALLSRAPDLSGDRLPGAYLDAIASGSRQHGDSLHLLVMDAHRALNRLQAHVATETLDGASVYWLLEDHRDLVSAFMAGLRATAPLKFDHPGLGTTATTVGSRLLIQNDIGQTEAHVVVIAVEDLVATVTYTDVHLQRLRFFERLLDQFPVRWSGPQRRRGATALGEHHLATGRYEAPDRASLEAYLRHLGSRLVFLIDWNRARKRLSTLVGKRDAVDLLRWAADAGCGHMGFLVLGGERLVYDAVELAARIPARYGEPLRDVLGPEATLEVLRFAIRAAADGLLNNKSHLLIRDELRVELLKHVEAAHRRLLDAAAEHGSLVVETAQVLRAALLRLGTADGDAFLRRASTRAAAWEHAADEILTAVRLSTRRVDGAESVADLLSTGDDAIDDLEEALFLLTLLHPDATPAVRPVLDPLAAVAVAAAREHLKALEIAREVVDAAGPDDLEDFLVAVDRVVTLEHEADNADRLARASLVEECPDFRSLHVADSVSRAIEDSTDALMRSALRLRDHLLGPVLAR